MSIKNKVVVSALLLALGGTSIANAAPQHSGKAGRFAPYLQLGGNGFHNGGQKTGKAAVSVDLFMPVLQTADSLFFAQARFFDRSAKASEGNFHLGYRRLSPEQNRLYGVYASLDRNRSNLGSCFSQISVGAEAWINKFFMGANFYQPVGAQSKLISVANEKFEVDNAQHAVWVTGNGKYERALHGADAQVGYEIKDGLVGYVGGYYFNAKDVKKIIGPKVKIAYDLSLRDGKRMLGIFDKVGLEAGVKKDSVRGTTVTLAANLRVSLSAKENNKLTGVSRHMVDLVRRDADVVVSSLDQPVKDAAIESGYDKLEKEHTFTSPHSGKSYTAKFADEQHWYDPFTKPFRWGGPRGPF